MIELGAKCYFHVQIHKKVYVWPGIVRGLWLDPKHGVTVHILTDVGFYKRRARRVYASLDAAKREVSEVHHG